MNTMYPSPGGSPDSRRRPAADDASSLIDDLVSDLAPVAPLRWHVPALHVLTAIAISVVFVATVLGVRADLIEGRVDTAFVLSTGLIACLSAASVHAVIGMARPQVGSSRPGMLWAVVMAALLPCSAVLVAVLDWLHEGRVAVDMSEVTCLLLGVGLGVLVAVALVGWLRRGAPTSPGQAGWFVGLASGAAGAFVYALHCPYEGILHLGLWHGGGIAVSALLGRAIVPALIRW